MKKLLLPLLLALPSMAYAQDEVATDSVSNTLDEVVVTADAQIETAKKVILRPTKQEKRHSTNGYSLLENMNLPDFKVDASAKSISTIAGGDVRILVNGVEVDSDELATLAASEIVQIDYRRNPGGRYVGSGAVMNFITVQYDYGGNVYLSADEGLARKYGNYIGMVNYKRNALTLTLTANGKWDNFSQLNSAENVFMLNDGLLNQSVAPIEGKNRTNSQYVNFKLAHATQNHSFDVSLALTRSATPKNYLQDNITYNGLYDFTSSATRNSTERGLSPVLKMHYNLYLPGGHTIMANANIRHSHTNYRSNYRETDVDEIQNDTEEDNVLASATLGYFKQFASGLSLGATVDEYYNYYHDVYSGSYTSKQILKNNHTMAMLHLDQNLPFGLSYYLSAGITNLYSTIGDHDDKQFATMAFYGVTYAVNQRHALSVSGNYAHSIYNPQYKNDAVIRTSFFEATMGNPDLGQLNAFQNIVSYNGRAGHFGFSATYDFLKYFDNTSNRYFAEDNIMYHQLVNDGNFSYNKLIFGLSANLLDNKLRLKGNTTFSMNRFDSEYRPGKSKDWRADFSASYMFGDWQVKGVYALPYNALGIEGTKVHNPAQYGLSLNWKHGNWAAECSVENFLDRRMATRIIANYGVYQSVSESLSDLKGRNISVSVTYTMPYGKKTDRDSIETESKINSAILRPF
ncbi:MAG: outer membrane beta-barrel family protein [Muribaculaceae bacterium]|nr:outer membrane beta-barrel family protein [Muribaculaceae bacterium]